MTQPMPDRIDVIVDVETRVRPESISLHARVSGSASIGTEAALRKGREIVAIIDLLARHGIAESALVIHSVSFEAAEGWLSGSSAQMGIELRKLPLEKAPDIIAALSTAKGVALVRLHREYGDMRAQRDELLERGVAQCLQQARVIASAAGVPLLGIYTLQQQWVEPEERNLPVSASLPRGMERGRIATVDAQDVKGFQVLQQYEAKLGVQLRMTLRVGAFAGNG